MWLIRTPGRSGRGSRRDGSRPGAAECRRSSEREMKWFGRKAARAAGRPFLFAGWRHVFAAEPWPRSYEAQVREACLANPVAQRCVRLVAESVAWAPVFANEARPAATALLTPAL